MKMHRFFLNQALPQKGEMGIRDEEIINQLKNVLRKKAGDTVTFFNGNYNEYVSRVVTLSKNELRFNVERVEQNQVSPKRNVSLYQSMLKKDNLEWIIQKGTEIGMQKFTPIISERSEKKGFNIERAQKIAIEAVEQSGRGVIPEINEAVSLETVLSKISGEATVFHKGGIPVHGLDQNSGSISIFIGPEGGWTETELKVFNDRNVRVASLGEATLRGETAAIAALSLLLLH